jgi:hypothetical protein
MLLNPVNFHLTLAVIESKTLKLRPVDHGIRGRDRVGSAGTVEGFLSFVFILFISILSTILRVVRFSAMAVIYIHSACASEHHSYKGNQCSAFG